MTVRFFLRLLLAMSWITAFLHTAAIHAQPAPAKSASTNPVNQPGGTGPISIDSDRLEVLDKEKKAIFSGNVVAIRGDMTVRASIMTAFYDGDLAAGQNQPAGQPRANQGVRRIEMSGKVFFNQKDQQATGDAAVYDRTNETLTLTGDVILTQCQNVIKGPRLIVDLRTNKAQIEGAPGSRVRSLLVPNDPATPGANQPAGAGCGQPSAPAPAPTPPSAKRKP